MPRLVFINKLDRMGSNPARVIAAAREKLRLNCSAVQVLESGQGGQSRARALEGQGRAGGGPVPRQDKAAPRQGRA